MINLDDKDSRRELVDLIYESMDNAKTIAKIKIECFYDYNGIPNVTMKTTIVERKAKGGYHD